MSSPLRRLFPVVAGVLLLAQAGCHFVPYPVYRQSQVQATRFYHEKMLADQQNADLQQQLAAAQSANGTFQARIDNLKNGMSKMQEHHQALIERLRKGDSPLGPGITRRLQDLSGRYPNFEFDPATGVSKFHADILFDVGSAQVKRQGTRLLQEFAAIMNEGDARGLNVLVVGHTDDRRIAQGSTRQVHPTNWHLSTNRANSVVLRLARFGIAENRLGAAGYSMHQPVTPNTDDHRRQMNRRVEIYVLAPDAAVAGRWSRESHYH